MHRFMTHSFRESLTHSENRLIAFQKKSQVCLGIQTRLARTECRRSATCVTTTAFPGVLDRRLVFKYSKIGQNVRNNCSLSSTLQHVKKQKVIEKRFAGNYVEDFFRYFQPCGFQNVKHS